MDILSRKDAKALGEKTYFTGNICSNGHISYRYTQSGSCAECINGNRATSVPKHGESKAAALRRKADEIEKRENEKAVILQKRNDNMLKLATERQVILQNQQTERAQRVLEITQRNEVLKRFVKFKEPIRRHYVENVKALLLAYGIMRNPHITIDHVWPGNPPKYEVLYTMSCHDDDLDAIRNQIQKWFAIDSDVNAIRDNIIETRILNKY